MKPLAGTVSEPSGKSTFACHAGSAPAVTVTEPSSASWTAAPVTVTVTGSLPGLRTRTFTTEGAPSTTETGSGGTETASGLADCGAGASADTREAAARARPAASSNASGRGVR